MLDDNIVQAIRDHHSNSPTVIREAIQVEYGVNVPPTTILRVLNDKRRADNVASSQLKASERMEEKVELTERLIESYLAFMEDPTIKASERLTAMRDLRGWVKLAMDSAGDAKDSDANLFEIAEEWDLGFEPREVN